MKWLQEPDAISALLANVPSEHHAAVLEYFTMLRRDGIRELKSRAVALYDPFADRRTFPAGVRYCINVFVGCSHACMYCYTANYIKDATRPRAKPRLLHHVQRDLDAIKAFRLPPIPLHISNSTDPFQATLECQTRNCHDVMVALAEHRDSFSQITFLTKNPALAATPEYVSLLHALAPCQVEVSCSLASEVSRVHYEPGAPSIASRLEGIESLVLSGIPVTLRIDPLMPREPLPEPWWPHEKLSDYGVEEAHSLRDIETLMRFAWQVSCQKVVVSPLKLPFGRRSQVPLRSEYAKLFAAPFGRLRARGTSYRLPEDYVRQHLIGEVEQLGAEIGVHVEHCRHNLVTTI